MSLLVEVPGLLTTFQDLGRFGHQHQGIGPSGAMDAVSHRFANLLVGNPPGEPTLEITLAGPTLRFEVGTLVALCGGDLSARLDGEPFPLWRTAFVRTGSRLSFGRPLEGARCYLAVGGGFRVPQILGSVSTHLGARFGGFQGRALVAGDRLETRPELAPAYPGLRERLGREPRAFAALDGFVPWFRELDFVRPCVLRMIPGSQWDELAPASREAFQAAEFRVSPHSNRMGLRLEGPVLTLAKPREMISAPVATGTVQLPAGGEPILLMADRQTTGGYPRLGEVASVDLPRAAQLRAGERLRFRLVSLEEARHLLLRREERLRAVALALEQGAALARSRA